MYYNKGKKRKAHTEHIGIMVILQDVRLTKKISILWIVKISVNIVILISNSIQYNDHITNMNS